MAQSHDTASQEPMDIGDLKRRVDAGYIPTEDELAALEKHGRCPGCGKLPEADSDLLDCGDFHRQADTDSEDPGGAAQADSADTGQANTANPSAVLDAVYEWHDAGLNPIPVREDGSKAPALKQWRELQTKRFERADLPQLFAGRRGIFIVTGNAYKADGAAYEDVGLEVLDFDRPEVYEAFKTGLEAAGLSDVFTRMREGYEEQTPGGGAHIPYLCTDIGRNSKLAEEPTGEVDATGVPKRKTLIEVRGRGGGIIAAPSHGPVHPSGNPYVRTQGSPATIAHITPDERTALFDYARTFSTIPEQTGSRSSGPSTGPSPNPGHRIGDSFNKHATWADVLVPLGWAFIREADGTGYWRRPGAVTGGHDVTTNANGTNRLFAHSTSTPFDTERYYDLFTAYAVLYHGGDFKVAAAALKANWDPASGFRDTATESSTGPEDSRDVVKLDVDNVNTIGDRIVESLQKRNEPPSLFTDTGGELVTVRVQADGTPTIDHFSEHQAREHFMRTIKFESPGKVTKANPNPEPVERSVPLDIVRNVQGRRSLPLPVLTGITTAPSFAADGSIRLQRGYDPATRTYLHPIGGVDFSDPALDRDPTSVELRQAVNLLEEMLQDYPFVTEVDRANTVAGLVQQAGADLIGGSIPILAFDKPTPGTGASKLVATLTTPFTGPHGVPPMTHPANDAEFEKTLVAKHLQSSRYAYFDNVDGRFGTPLLAEALTTPTKELRVLGSNRTVRARMPRFWYLTGNNPTYADDLIRRIVPIRLDAKVARPWERTGFRHVLPTWAWDNRVRIVRAVLTIWKAWLAAGRPMGTQTMGSFESWARTMGGVLDVAGIPGFLTNTSAFYDRADVEGAAWQAVVDAWWDEFGSDAVTVRELIFLPAVTEGLAVGLSDKDRKEFGTKLRKQRDRQYGDLKVTVAGQNRDKVQTYRLQHRDGIVRPRRKHDGESGDVINLFRKQS